MRIKVEILYKHKGTKSTSPSITKGIFDFHEYRRILKRF